jgi:hypothetical protein
MFSRKFTFKVQEQCFSRWPSLPRVRSSPLAATHRACTYHRSTFLQRPLTSARNGATCHTNTSGLVLAAFSATPASPMLTVRSKNGNVRTRQRPTPIYACVCDSALPCRRSPCISPRYESTIFFRHHRAYVNPTAPSIAAALCPYLFLTTPHFSPST